MDINKSMALSASFKSSLSHQTAAPNMNAGGVPIHVKVRSESLVAWSTSNVSVPSCLPGGSGCLRWSPFRTFPTSCCPVYFVTPQSSLQDSIRESTSGAFYTGSTSMAIAG